MWPLVRSIAGGTEKRQPCIESHTWIFSNDGFNEIVVITVQAEAMRISVRIKHLLKAAVNRGDSFKYPFGCIDNCMDEIETQSHGNCARLLEFSSYWAS